MRWLQGQVVKAILISTCVGCGFSPGKPGEYARIGATGAGGSGTSTGSGNGGVNSSGTGIGLTSSTGGGGGDVGFGTGGASCGQSSVPVMPEPPDILIVQDKSLSKDQDSTGANSQHGRLLEVVAGFGGHEHRRHGHPGCRELGSHLLW